MRGKLRTTLDRSSRVAFAPISPTSSRRQDRQVLRRHRDLSLSHEMAPLRDRLGDATRSHRLTRAKRGKQIVVSWLASIRPTRRHPPASASALRQAWDSVKALAKQTNPSAHPLHCVQVDLLPRSTRRAPSTHYTQHRYTIAIFPPEATLPKAHNHQQHHLDPHPSNLPHLADAESPAYAIGTGKENASANDSDPTAAGSTTLFDRRERWSRAGSIAGGSAGLRWRGCRVWWFGSGVRCHFQRQIRMIPTFRGAIRARAAGRVIRTIRRGAIPPTRLHPAWH